MEPFGPDHIGAFAATVISCAGALWLGRRVRGTPAARTAGRALALVLLACQVADPFICASYGWLSWRGSLPLQLCDAASFAMIAALWTHRQTAFELAYFWTLAGTIQAILSPDMGVGFPHVEFLRFFILHIGTVAAVFYLGPGLGLRPRRNAEWRVYGWSAVYTACVGLVDWAIGANYMYLAEKPPSSPLDFFGPWPWYILGGAAMAAVVYPLVALPYRFSPYRFSTVRSNSRR
ncbi:MAG: YwaF family protein [Planctomycetota bacterium]|jgi:hypothetical integral membrane protein (TIGR02206 family)